MHKVVIVQQRLFHYRIALFQALRERCHEHSIELRLVHGRPTPREIQRHDTGTLSWADAVSNWYYSLNYLDLIWISLPREHFDADLIVLMQENRQLHNYRWLLERLWSRRKIAFWGHGANLQSDAPTGFRERWKQFLSTKVDWWFAYTQSTVDILSSRGYPLSQISTLNNAIDTNGFKAALSNVSGAEIEAARSELGIEMDAPVGIYCGSLYPDKKLDFLIEVIDRIKLSVPSFHCLILGDGPLMELMLDAATSRSWLHVKGTTKGLKKALYFRTADFMLNPGAVGLNIVDAFCSGQVLITTDKAKHGPEIAYLNNGVNAIMTTDCIDEYVQVVLQLIDDKVRLDRLKKAALADSEKYTLDNMVSNFVDGILRCIEAPK